MLTTPPPDPRPDEQPRSVPWVLGWVSFFQDFGSKMLVPIMPLFLTQVLGAPPVAVGLSEGIGEATASLTRSWSGRVADRKSPLPLIRFGYGLSTVAKVVIGVVGHWGTAIMLRSFDRLGKGLRDAPRDALLAADTANAGRAFGLQQAMDKAGGFIGPLVGLAVFTAFGERLRPVFAAAAVPCVISVALLWLIRSDAPAAHKKVVPRPPREELRAGYRRLAPMVIATSCRVPEGLVVLRLVDLGASTTQVLLSYSALRAVNAVAAYPLGALADSRRPAALVAGGVGMAGALQLLLVADSMLLALVVFPLFGVVDALTRSPLKRAVVNLSASHRGTMLGDMQAASGVLALVIGLLVGLAWSSHSSLSLIVLGVFGLLAALAVGRRGDLLANEHAEQNQHGPETE